MLTRFLRNFLLALQFFSRIPVTGRLAAWVGYSPAMLRASAAHFPGVGCVIGSLTSMVLAGLLWGLPHQPAAAWVAVALSMVFSILLTGAFHEDGLADTADGLGGGFTRERALEIMKDSRIGSYGAIALVMALLVKLSVLVLLAQSSSALAVWGLLGAHVTSRLMPLFVIRSLPYVGDASQSKSKPLADNIGNAGVLVGIGWWLAVTAVLLGHIAALPYACGGLGAFIAMLWMRWRLSHRLQGFTGDGLGATQQLAEIGFYLGLALAGTAA